VGQNTQSTLSAEFARAHVQQSIGVRAHCERDEAKDHQLLVHLAQHFFVRHVFLELQPNGARSWSGGFLLRTDTRARETHPAVEVACERLPGNSEHQHSHHHQGCAYRVDIAAEDCSCHRCRSPRGHCVSPPTLAVACHASCRLGSERLKSLSSTDGHGARGAGLPPTPSHHAAALLLVEVSSPG
jgi:hypothetical protein